MKLSELKSNLLNNTLGDSLLIFIWSENTYLVNQYVKEIAKRKNQSIHYVDTYSELVNMHSNENVFGDELEEDTLNVLSVDVFDEMANEVMTTIKNTIIICNKIAKEVIHTYESYKESLIVEFPKLEPWQIKDYMKVVCSGLSSESIDKLYEITSGNIFRIDNELNKISCFSPLEQNSLFLNMLKSGAYSDLTQLTIFNFTNALVKRDFLTIGDSLRNIKNMDVDAIGLSTILHKNIKNIIDIQMNNKATPDSLGMSVKQFKAIEYNCGKISNDQLIRLLKFFDEIDFKLKSGGLDMNNDAKIDYIVCKVLE